MNQPRGDPYTTFVVYGRGWRPGTRVTVALAGGPTFPDPQVVDRAGSFNYTVNQRHEFFPAGLPVGLQTVVVTFSDGQTKQVSFQVQNP